MLRNSRPFCLIPVIRINITVRVPRSQQSPQSCTQYGVVPDWPSTSLSTYGHDMLCQIAIPRSRRGHRPPKIHVGKDQGTRTQKEKLHPPLTEYGRKEESSLLCTGTKRKRLLKMKLERLATRFRTRGACNMRIAEGENKWPQLSFSRLEGEHTSIIEIMR